MISAQELQGKWSSIRGKVKEKWGQLTEDDLMIAGGNVDQLVGKIEQKTGETRQAIESFFSDLMRGGGGQSGGIGHVVHEAYEHTRDALGKSRDAVQHVGEQAAQRARDGYRRAEHLVQDYPATSVASAFMGGVLTGIAIGLLLVGDRK